VSEASLRRPALRTAIRLEVFTVAWMGFEAVIAIGAGIAAHSVLLSAFGADSLIELVSGGLLLWRLQLEVGHGDGARAEATERRATRISAWLLVLLCAYVVLFSAGGLALGVRPEGSVVGIAISALALVVMPVLAWRKSVANEVIGSAALKADVAESMTCAYMAAATLGGVLVNTLTGLWAIEYVAAFALLYWLVGETREAFGALRDGG
jgi:divalent metal cation (Fe/Co/Zn/Cd) transporter